MLVEDLGSTTLEARLIAHPEEELSWAREVGAQLAIWLGLLTEGAPPRAFFMLRRFDHAKFQFEWDFCRTNFFGDFLQKEPPLWLDRMMEDIHNGLEARTHSLAHRDFHVRNLMVHGDRLVTLDFQDARKAAATYDLASILFDGYWDWSEEARAILVRSVEEELGWSETLLLGGAEPQRHPAEPEGPGHLRLPDRAPQQGPFRPGHPPHPPPPPGPLPAPPPRRGRARRGALAALVGKAAAEDRRERPGLVL